MLMVEEASIDQCDLVGVEQMEFPKFPLLEQVAAVVPRERQPWVATMSPLLPRTPAGIEVAYLDCLQWNCQAKSLREPQELHVPVVFPWQFGQVCTIHRSLSPQKWACVIVSSIAEGQCDDELFWAP
eukprot:m.351909 g.351909  ORF g.351909 m.351909 type:complete len:127 (+) comp16580_c1_seq1:2083-2463(+)